MLTKEIQISCFKDYKTAVNPVTIPLIKWLTSSKYKNEVERIRSTADKAEKNRLKALLPAITPSGIFTQRKRNALVKHSGFICLDIDLQDNEDVTNYYYLDKEIEKIKNIAYCGLSVSGLGLFVLIPIAYPEQHESHFRALQRDFASYGITIDEKCKDVCRLRGYSYDERAYFNFNAVPYTKLYKETKKIQTPKQFLRQNQYVNNVQQSVELLIEKINVRKVDITADRGRWLALATAMASNFGETGRTYFHAISQYYPGYDRAENDKLFDDVKRRGYNRSIGVFFNACKDYGITFKN